MNEVHDKLLEKLDESCCEDCINEENIRVLVKDVKDRNFIKDLNNKAKQLKVDVSEKGGRYIFSGEKMKVNDVFNFAFDKSIKRGNYDPATMMHEEAELDAFIKALKIPFAVRDYQKEAFVYATKKNRCLLLSPTASGKSLITYLLVRFNILRLKEQKKKILIIVPTTSLVEQLFKDFKSLRDLNLDFDLAAGRNINACPKYQRVSEIQNSHTSKHKKSKPCNSRTFY